MGINEEVEKILEEAQKKHDFIDSAIKEVKSNTSFDESTRDAFLNEETWGLAWEYLQNGEWCKGNLVWIKEKYPGQVVLIFDRKIFFNGEDPEETRTKLRSLGNRKNECYVYYVPKKGENSLLYTSHI